MQGRLVRVPVDASRVVLRHAPLAALQRPLHLEGAVLQPELDVGLTRRVHPIVERPVEAVRVLLGIAPPAGRTGW